MPSPQGQAPESLSQSSPEAALLTTRVLWLFMIPGQIIFGLIILSAWRRGETQSFTPEAARNGFVAAIVATLVFIPLGYFARNQFYKRHWRGSVIAPPGYILGNVVLFFCCHIAIAAGLTAALLRGSLFPAGLISLIAAAVYAVNFPHGKVLFPPRDAFKG